MQKYSPWGLEASFQKGVPQQSKMVVICDGAGSVPNNLQKR